jgi:hypothetical protein
MGGGNGCGKWQRKKPFLEPQKAAGGKTGNGQVLGGKF